MHPLILVDTIEILGTGKGVLQLAVGLRSRGTPVTLANFRYPGRPSAFDAAARSLGLDLLEAVQRHRLDTSWLATLRSAALARGCSVLESHSLKAHLAAWRLRGALGLPWVAHAHGWTAESRRVRAYNALERRLLRAPDHVCAVSGPLCDDLRAAGRDGPLTLLWNGIEPAPVPTAPLRRAMARAHYACGPGDVVLAAIGRLSREKGVDVLLEACVRARVPALRILIAGDGPERERLAAFVARHGLRARVTFLGHVADPHLPLAASDAVVLASRSEGVPNVALEALDGGVPLIGTRVGALPEMIDDGTTGWLVPPDDADALAAALRALAESPREVRARMAALARANILPRFSAARRIERVAEIYRGLLAGTDPTNRRADRGTAVPG